MLLCAMLLLDVGGADALIAGADTPYPDAARKLLRVIGTKAGSPRAAGMHLVRLRDRTLFFAGNRNCFVITQVNHVVVFRMQGN